MIADGGRRRRYGSEEKARLVASAFAPGVSVTAFARERGVDPSLLYRWRRRMGASTASAASFASVIATPDAPRSAPRADRGEIVLGNGRRMSAAPKITVRAPLAIRERDGRKVWGAVDETVDNPRQRRPNESASPSPQRLRPDGVERLLSDGAGFAPTRDGCERRWGLWPAYG